MTQLTSHLFGLLLVFLLRIASLLLQFIQLGNIQAIVGFQTLELNVKRLLLVVSHLVPLFAGLLQERGLLVLNLVLELNVILKRLHKDRVCRDWLLDFFQWSFLGW